MANFKCRVNGLFNGSFGWSYGFNCTASTDVATVAATLHSATSTFWTTATNGYQNYTFTDVATTSVTAYAMNSSWRTTNKSSQALTVAGTGTGASLPYDNGVTISLYGANDTKSDRGRIRLPAPLLSTVSGHAYTAGFTTSLTAIFSQFWTDMSALTAFDVVTYNTHTNKQGDPPYTLHTITNSKPSNKPCTMRMRTRKIIPVYGAASPIP